MRDIITRASPRIIILNVLAGTNWGQHKETILITYKSLIRSLFMYAAPSWFPINLPSLIQKLQNIQIFAIRIATSCVEMTFIDHLHEETKMLPIQYHLFLIRTQYLASVLQPNNPSHSINLVFSIVLFRIYQAAFYPL